MRRNRSAWLVSAAAFVALAAGCYVPAEKAPKSQQALDPCAERLHELAGKLLLFRFAQGHLPSSLAELPKGGATEMVCPVSAKTYVYRRDGPAAPGWEGRMVAWDATACHRGGRWVVTLAQPAGGAVTAKVVWVSEEAFVKAVGGM